MVRLEPDPINAHAIRWSPDGHYVSVLHAADGLSNLNTIRVYDLSADTTFDLLSERDWTVMSYEWLPGDTSMIVHVIDRTVSGLYQVSLDGVIDRKYNLQRRVLEWGDLSVDGAGAILACVVSTGTRAAAVATIDLNSGDYRGLVEINPEAAEWLPLSTEVVTWTNPEGVALEGVLYAARSADSNHPLPLMVYPHGGPDGVSMDYYSKWAHFFVANGYSVFRPNYRGGIGYGFDFYAANRGRLGEIEWMDIESGVDQLIADGKADPDHLVYGGWSWGGYLTAWTIGHTDRYKAAVVGAGVSDVRNQYVTSDINHGIVGDWEYLGNPWQQAENFERANPVRYLTDVTTPTLIIHGTDDERVHFVQGLTLYRALYDVGCEVSFLTYPREPHGFKEPAHTAHMLDAWAAWYSRHDAD
jgi:dipeptidyl aminopeptidase/acylaminoacyl peptidase